MRGEEIDRERRTDGRTDRRHGKTGKTRGQVERDADQMKTAAEVVVERDTARHGSIHN